MVTTAVRGLNRLTLTPLIVGLFLVAGCAATTEAPKTSATGASASPAKAAVSSAFDGTYRPSISSKSGDKACGGLVWETFKIDGGELKGALNHSDAGYFRLKGSVGADGNLVGAKAVGSYTSATFEGGFNGATASGTWKTSDDRCSGTWSASR